MKDPEYFLDIDLRRGNHRVVIEYIGEGRSGDYDPEDPEDRPHLRFACFEHDGVTDDLDCDDCWEHITDGSYCTLLTTDVPLQEIVRFAGILMDVLENNENPRKELEGLTWWRPDETT